MCDDHKGCSRPFHLEYHWLKTVQQVSIALSPGVAITHLVSRPGVEFFGKVRMYLIISHSIADTHLDIT